MADVKKNNVANPDCDCGLSYIGREECVKAPGVGNDTAFVQGLRGKRGPQGPAGPKGDTGEQGPVGPGCADSIVDASYTLVPSESVVFEKICLCLDMGGDGGEVSEIPRFAELCKDNVELGLDPAAASHPYEVTFTGSVSGSEAEIAKRFARYNTIFLYSIKLNDVEFDLGYCVDASDATRRGNCTGYEFEVGFSGVEEYTPNTPLPLGLLLSKVSISVDTSDPANMSVSYSFTLRLDAEAAFGGTPGALPATMLRVQGTRCDGTVFEADVDLMSMLVDNGFANATFRNLRGDLTMMFDLVQATAPNYDGVTVSDEYIEEIDGYRVRAVDVVTKKNRIADAVYGNALEQAAFRGQLGDPQSLVSNADKVITSSVLQAYGTTDGMPSGYDGNTAALLITQAFGDTNAFSNDKDVMQFAVFEALETNRPDIYWRHSHSADKDAPTWSEWVRLRFEPFVGATASAAGAAGFVPAPVAGDQNKFLHGDGKWSLVTDVAIGGNENDMASGRGQIGAAKEMPNLDFNTLITPGNYRITGNPTNGPSSSLNISGASIGSLIVAGIPGQNGRIFQIMISGSAVTWRTIQDSTGTAWSAWQQLLSGNKVGDGIRTTQGIISVPEYEGATASKAGTSGLVPPAAAGQHESFLTGGGEYKPVLTKISGSVRLKDSKTAASATAVKIAYDAAQSKLPLSGGTLTGTLRSQPGKIHIASTPSAEEVDDALYLVDATGVVYANLQATNYPDGSMLVGLAVNTSVKGGSGGWQTLKIGADKNGKFVSHVPTPDLTDASDNIANTLYVQENLKSYLKLAGGVLTGDVTVPSISGYQVVDHEVNGGWYFFPENFYNSGRNGRFSTKAGLKIQYGGVSGMSNVTQQVTFAEPFSTIPIVITTSESSGIEQIAVPLNVTTTGFSLGHMSAGTETGTVFKHWIAIGR